MSSKLHFTSPPNKIELLLPSIWVVASWAAPSRVFSLAQAPVNTAHDNDTMTIPKKSFASYIHVSGHTATYRTSVTANMYLIGERFFGIVIVSSVDRGFSGKSLGTTLFTTLRKRLQIVLMWRYFKTYKAGAGCSKDDLLKPGLVENHGTKFWASA